MSDLKSELESVIHILSQGIDHRNKFNNKYRTQIATLINRYDAVTGEYTQRGKSSIIFVDETVFKIRHYGYETDWTEEYPVALLTDPNFILELEAEFETKKQKQKQLVASRASELKQLEQLKAKYEQ